MKLAKKKFARQLRKKQTPYENKVWEMLRNRKFLGLKFRRQHVIEGFVVDFYCHELKLAIEIDGRVHDSRKIYDELRDEVVGQDGITILRISNDEIDKDINIVMKQITEALKNSFPLPQGEGQNEKTPPRYGYEKARVRV